MKNKIFISSSICIISFIVIFLFSITIFNSDNNGKDHRILTRPISDSTTGAQSDNSPQSAKVTTSNHKIEMLVRDENDNPIDSANVSVRDIEDSICISKFTNNEGTCYFQYNSDVHQSIIVSCSDFFDKKIALPYEGDRSFSFIPVCLEREKKIAGFVEDCSGVRIKNAKILIKKVQESDYVNSNSLSEISSEEGLFTFHPLVSGSYIVSVSHPQFLPKSVECQAGDDQIRVVLKNVVDINVLTVDDKDNPLGGIDISLSSLVRKAGILLLTKKTNVSGSAYFHDIPPSKYTITATASHFGISCVTEIDVRQTDFLKVKIEIQPTLFSISGKVLEFNTNKPIASATVICQSKNKLNLSVLSCTTCASGEFAFPDLYPGEYVLTLDELKGFMTGDYSRYQGLGANMPFSLSNYLSESVSDIIIWAKPAWFISGKVMNNQKLPVENTEVSLYFNTDRATRYGYRGNYDVGEKAFSDKEGKYELEGLFDLSDKTKVSVMAEHSFYGISSSSVLKPKPGERINNVDILFNEEPNIVGKVMDSSGSGIDGATVCLYVKMGEYIQPRGCQVTDSEGCYGMYSQPGLCLARAQAVGYKMPDDEKSKKVHIPEDGACTANFTLHDNKDILEGIVTDENNVPVSRVNIYALLYSENSKPAPVIYGQKIYTTLDDGLFYVDAAKMDNQCGECDLIKFTAIQEEPKDYESKSVEDVRLDSKELTIVLDEKSQDYTFEVYGTVIGSDNQPVQDFEILPFASRNSTLHSPPIDSKTHNWTPFFSAAGEFHLTGIDSRDSPFVFVARNIDGNLGYSDSYRFEPEEVKTGVIIQLQPPYSLSGRIVCQETGNPLKDAYVAVQYGVSSMDYYQKLHLQGYSTMVTVRGDHRQVQLAGDIPKIITGEDGRFFFQELSSPHMCLVITNTGYRSCFQIIDKSPMGEHLDIGDIALEDVSSGGNVRRDPDIRSN